MVSTYIRQHHLGLVAIFIAVTGTAYASNQLAPDYQGATAAKKKRGPKGPQGPAGPQGPQGAQGLPGVQGPPGQSGSSDTGSQILSKLGLVDGSGSGLDADFIDGLNSTAFLGANATASNADKLDNLDSTDFVQAQGATFTSAGLTDNFGGACPAGVDEWRNNGPDSNNPVGYYRDPFGIVHLRGAALRCGSPNSVIFTLPQGYRPESREYQVVAASSSYTAVEVMNVFADGSVVGNGVAGVSGAALDGITFRCGPSGSNGCP